MPLASENLTEQQFLKFACFLCACLQILREFLVWYGRLLSPHVLRKWKAWLGLSCLLSDVVYSVAKALY